MKSLFLTLALAFVTSYSAAVEVTFSPSQQAPSLTEQIRVQFSEAIKKVDNAFEVVCNPAVEGQGRWADNNTVWVYDISYGKDEYGDSLGLPGGASCTVSQKAALESASGKKWNKGALQHEFSVAGPSVVRVYNLPGFNGDLREENPVVMVVFDGDVQKETIYANPGSFLWYSMKNDYPAGKILLSPVPEDKEAELFKAFDETSYLSEYNVKKDSKNWAIVTINQNLIPGANINLSITAVKSAYSDKTMSVDANIELKVREQFSAQVQCDRTDEKSACMPEGSVRVNFNANVPWTMARQVQLQYVPQNSTDGKMVTATPDESNVISDWLSGSMSQVYENFVSLFSISTDKAVIENLSFNVKIKPNTEARVIFPADLADVDSRKLNQSSYALQFGSFGEVISFAKSLSVMEKNVAGNTVFPVSVMNLKQKITMTKSGAQAQTWSPVTSMPKVIDILLALEKWQDSYYNGDKADYDLFAAVGLESNKDEISVNGEKNKKTSLNVEFGKNKSGKISGVYVLGVKSQLSKENKTDYGVVVVTDLNVQLKMGAKNVVAWVTSYSTGLPVSQAQIEIYGCDKKVVMAGQADQNGLYTFSKETLPTCEYESNLLSGQLFIAVAKMGDDFAFTTSNSTANNSYAMNAPGVDYFYSDIQDDAVLIKSVIGVNLVKPGQSVPVQLFATVPSQKGFKAANPAELPAEVQITNSDDSNIKFNFPLEWKNGVAEIQWSVPKSVALGLYQLQVKRNNQDWMNTLDGDIEVGEFKVPVMTAKVSLPKGPLAKADDISVSGLIQYANGVGAKDQTVEVSYYFADAVISSELYEGYEFAKGVYTGSDQKQVDVVGLPTSEQAAKIENLTTDKQGSVQVDIGAQTITSGETISQLIAKATRPYQIVARIRYLDQMGEFQTVSAGQKIYNTTSYLGTKVTSGPMASAQLNVVNMATDGKSLAANSDVKLEVLAVETNVISEEVFGGFVKNIFENEVKKTKWTANCSNVKGVMACAVGALARGNYVFQATSKATGQSTYSRFTVDAEGIVNSENDYYYFDKADRSLLLGADKASYKGGDVAKLTFEKPFANCSALVTLERSDVIEAYVDSSACANGYVKVPVASELAPNVFTSVYLAAGRVNRSVSKADFDLGKPSYRVGYSNLKIDWERYSLDVKVKTDKTEYKPKDMATVEVEITPEKGRVFGGDVTLVVIEEKILELRENKTYDLLSNLMGLREHSVSLANSYNLLTSVAQVQAAVEAEAAMEGAKGGQEGGSGSEFESMDRKLFDALVSWQTKVPVVNGKAIAQFQVNDKLTKFKVFAIVNDTNKFGTGETSYVSAQALQTFANISSVARTGDQFPVSVTLQNNAKAAEAFTAVVDYKIYDGNGNVIQKGALKKTTQLDSGSSKVVQVDTLTVPALASKAVYDVTIYNQNGLVVDKLANEVQDIQPAIPVTVQEQYLVQMENNALELVLAKDKEAVVGLGQIETSVFSSLVGSAAESVKSSLSNSPFATLTVENQILTALINSSAKDTKALETVFAELISQVDGQGMIKYYPGASRGSYWMTVEVVQLIAAQDWALKSVPAQLKNQWKSAFERVIAGEMEPAYISESSDMMIFLAASMKAANALVLMGGKTAVPQAADLIAQVEGQKNLNTVFEETVIDTALLAAQTQPEKMAALKVMKFINASLLNVKDTSALIKSKARIGWWGYADEIISTAKMVKALSMASQSKGATSSSANFIDSLVKGLVNANADKQWYTVRTKAWALNGLTSFAKVFESQPVTGTTQIATTESSIVASVLWGSNIKENGVGYDWADDSATLNFSHTGQGRPWVSVTAKAAVPVKGNKSQGFKVTKTMKNVSRQDGTFAPGDMIQVEVKIESATSMSNVAMLDPIPAGANILSEGWGPYSMAQKSYEGYKVYFEYLSEGETTITYQYQLNNPGVFQIPPTRVEALYEPSLFGAAENKTMTVK